MLYEGYFFLYLNVFLCGGCVFLDVLMCTSECG
uniref:Uncharacterized protein n=1 Tax=Arundo donax TaxID=35708 RepID=A0A0A9BRF9_ARUDO